MRRMMEAGLVLALALTLMACRSTIQQGLDERQANEIVTLLGERSVSAQKRMDGGKKASWSIDVRPEDASEAVRVMAELGLPREKPAGFSELFGKGSLVPSAAEERARFLQATSGEMARTLEAFEGVVTARVHLVLPATGRPGQPTSPTKASAFLRVRPGASARLLARSDELRALIAGGAEGLSSDGVTVVVDEVVSAPAAASPPPATPTGARLRVLALALAVTVLLLALALILLTLKLRSLRCRLGKASVSPPHAAPEASAVAALARKVAAT